MIAFLQLFLAPLVASALTLWAGCLALGAESDADLPKALGGEFSGEAGAGTLSRNLHVAHLCLLVLAGANGRTLAWGPGHAESSAAPGTAGNAVVTGHRDTHFAFLRDLAPGERIVVERRDGTITAYRVERRILADYRMLKLPAGGDEPMLSLVTCWPFDGVDPGTPLRYAVLARADGAR